MSHEKLNDSTRTAEAVAAAVAIASVHGVKVDSPRVLADAYSVRVHLHPAPIVARVSTLTALLRSPIETWLAREISVVEFLASRGVSVIPPSDRLPAIPHQHNGLFMTFWRYVQPVSDGDIAWDLINLDDAARAAYPNAPDAVTLAPYIKLRQLHAIIWVYALLPEFSDWATYAKAMLDSLRDAETA